MNTGKNCKHFGSITADVKAKGQCEGCHRFDKCIALTIVELLGELHSVIAISLVNAGIATCPHQDLAESIGP